MADHSEVAYTTADGKSAVVTDISNKTVGTIKVANRTKDPGDIDVDQNPQGVAIRSDGKKAFVTNLDDHPGIVVIVDLVARTSNEQDLVVGNNPADIVITPCQEVPVTTTTAPTTTTTTTRSGTVTPTATARAVSVQPTFTG